MVERKANSTIEQQKCKGHEKRDRLLISKIEIIYQISQRNESFASEMISQRNKSIDPVFSNRVN